MCRGGPLHMLQGASNHWPRLASRVGHDSNARKRYLYQGLERQDQVSVTGTTGRSGAQGDARGRVPAGGVVSRGARCPAATGQAAGPCFQGVPAICAEQTCLGAGKQPQTNRHGNVLLTAANCRRGGPRPDCALIIRFEQNCHWVRLEPKVIYNLRIVWYCHRVH